jgi:uncharacterized protein
MKAVFLKFLWGLIKVIGGAYLVLLVVLAFNQSTLLFFPSHNPNQNQSWIANNTYMGIQVPVKDPRRIFLMIHGNGGQADHRASFFYELPVDSSLYILEYPSYGPRKGVLSQNSLNAAAIEAYDTLKQQFPSLPIVIVGQSVGTGVAAYLASQRPISHLILITPYHDMPSLAQEM